MNNKVTVSQDVRDSRASQFLQMVKPLEVIIYQGQKISNKEIFIQTSLDIILDGHVDHVSDIQNMFDVLARFYLENTAKIIVI
jgi:hypothetical protein